jgi:hypothetical protein
VLAMVDFFLAHSYWPCGNLPALAYGGVRAPSHPAPPSVAPAGAGGGPWGVGSCFQMRHSLSRFARLL